MRSILSHRLEFIGLPDTLPQTSIRQYTAIYEAQVEVWQTSFNIGAIYENGVIEMGLPPVRLFSKSQ